MTKEENMLASFENVISKSSLEQIKSIGIPSSKSESWRYSSLPSFAPTQKLVTGAGKNPQLPSHLLDMYPNRLVICAGKIIENATKLERGITLESQDSAILSSDFIGVLSSGITQIQHRISLDGEIAKPLALIIVEANSHGECSLEANRLLISTTPGTSAEIIEIQLMAHNEDESANVSWRNDDIALELAPNTHLGYVKLVSSNEHALSLSKFTADLKRDAHLTQTLVTLGGKLTRQDVKVNLLEEGSHASIRSLSALRQSEQADLNAFIYHKAANTTSSQLVKNILDDKSRGVFTGKIYIEKNAIGVDSNQLSRALLLSKKAQMNARPQLEIYADDVKAAHGATIGQLSDEELFYLQSRGLTSSKARQMLCHGFGLEVISQIKSADTRELIEASLHDQFERHALANLDGGNE